MSDSKKYIRLSELMLSFCDGDLTPVEMAELEALIGDDDEAIEYCVDLLMDNSFFCQTGQVSVPNKSGGDSSVVSSKIVELLSGADEILEDSSFDLEVWKMLADAERAAEGLPRQKCSSQEQELIRKVERQKGNYTIKRSSLLTFAASIAAILMVVIFIKFAPPKTGVEVATLVDSLNAKWADATIPVGHGMRLRTSHTPMFLREGMVEVLFDNNAQVVIEGPAEFCVMGDDRVQLSYGMLYAEVPNEAIGFTVNTPTVKVIDLGTEFGVKAGFNGDVELHVVKGKTTMISGHGGQKASQDVIANEAKLYSAQGQTTSDIQCAKQQFARDIDSTHQFYWRGQEVISLADMVGGGNGFGIGMLNAGVSYEGQIGILDAYSSDTGPTEFVPVQGSAFVDGVFIPNGPTQINTAGVFYDGFEQTNNKYWLGVLNGAWHQIDLTVKVTRHQLRLNGFEYGTEDRPAIYMASNQGVTFDLQAIRQHTGMRIREFTSLCGLSETYGDHWDSMKKYSHFMELPKATFQVLVDGESRFIKKDMTYKDPVGTISVELTPTDRYLTLVTTQGSDKSNNGDWTLFAEPVLQIEQK